jgi:hypothetical protein
MNSSTRRDALQGLGLIALAAPTSAAIAAAAPVASAASGPRIDRAQLLDDFIRLRTAPDGEPVLWVYSGVLVVKPEGEVAQPVVRVEGVSRSQATARADGSWDWQLDEAGYYCDLQSGDVLERLDNPFTGASIRPRHYRSPQRLVFARDGITPGQAVPTGVQFRGEITRLAAVAGLLALTEDLYVRMPGSPARQAASLATFTTDAENLHRPRSQWVDCQFSYTTLNSLSAWLEMPGVGGVQDMRLIGVKCRRDDRKAVPAWLRARVQAEHPDLL